MSARRMIEDVLAGKVVRYIVESEIPPMNPREYRHDNEDLEPDLHADNVVQAAVEKHRSFSRDEAYAIGNQIKVDWQVIDIDQFRMGLSVELEHGICDPQTNITSDDLAMTGRLVWAHLKEVPDYYTRLAQAGL